MILRPLIAVAGAFSLVLAMSAPASATVSTQAATLLEADGSATLATGSPYPGNTVFRLGVPPGAKCPGDSATGGFHVNGYISRGAPGALTFTTQGPTPDAWSLVDAGEVPFEEVNTYRFTGQLMALPQFSMARYLSADPRTVADVIPSGTYNVGVVCSTGLGVPTTVWNTRVELSQADGAQGTFTPESRPPVSSSRDILGYALVAAVAAAVAVLLLRRRRPPSPPRSARRSAPSGALR